MNANKDNLNNHSNESNLNIKMLYQNNSVNITNNNINEINDKYSNNKNQESSSNNNNISSTNSLYKFEWKEDKQNLILDISQFHNLLKNKSKLNKNIRKGFKIADLEIKDNKSNNFIKQVIKCPEAGKLVKFDSECIVLERCQHNSFFGNQCTDCGININNNINTRNSYLSLSQDIHFSNNQAKKLEVEVLQKLKNNKKLILLLDVDNTILHSTSNSSFYNSKSYFDSVTNNSDNKNETTNIESKSNENSKINLNNNQLLPSDKDININESMLNNNINLVTSNYSNTSTQESANIFNKHKNIESSINQSKPVSEKDISNAAIISNNIGANVNLNNNTKTIENSNFNQIKKFNIVDKKSKYNNENVYVSFRPYLKEFLQ